jgi:hypothetical protein
MICKRPFLLALVTLTVFAAMVRGNPVIQVQRTNGQILLQWQSQSNHSYRVLAADQIGQAWITQLTNLPVMNTNPRLSYIDPVMASNGVRFYRIAELSNSPPISIVGKTNVVISDLFITNVAGAGVTIINCSNVVVRNCLITHCTNEAVHVESSSNVSITSNRFEYVSSGVWALSSTQIRVTYNQCLNVQGPFPRGQLAQFDKCYGSNNCINFNLGQNVLGQSNPEDEISIFQSNGTSNSPIQIIGNEIRGGGPSGSGGGIMTGDGGGSYILVTNNILVDPGQYGIGIAGGDHVQVLSNKIYGKQQPFTNVGIYVWNQTELPCGSHVVTGNQVRWYNSSGVENPGWNNGNCGTVDGWDANDWHANLDESLVPQQLF